MFITGAMKTYWLEDRESRPSLTKIISKQIQPVSELEWERAADVRDSIAEHSAQNLNKDNTNNKELNLNKELNYHHPNSINSGPNSLTNNVPNQITFPSPTTKNQNAMMSPAEERRMYSPVTFQDVARRSIANSPNRTEKDKGTYIIINVKKIQV